MSFIVQKLLIQKHRDPEKQAQDTLYIHDTLELFGASLEELQKIWENDVRPKMADTMARRAIASGSKLFENVTDVIREAARIPQDRHLEPENLRAAVRYGLEEVFGSFK